MRGYRQDVLGTLSFLFDTRPESVFGSYHICTFCGDTYQDYASSIFVTKNMISKLVSPPNVEFKYCQMCNRNEEIVTTYVMYPTDPTVFLVVDVPGGVAASLKFSNMTVTSMLVNYNGNFVVVRKKDGMWHSMFLGFIDIDNTSPILLFLTI